MKGHPEDHLAAQFDGLDHADKIAWMIEANGWALEAVPADPVADPPAPARAYTVGVPAAVGFPDVAVFGLTPAAANGLLTLVVDACRGGTEIPVGVEVVGLLDNDLRCAFVEVDVAEHARLFTTAAAWYRSEPWSMVQMVYPDRNGFLPYETGYEQRMRLAQPVLGRLTT